MGILNSLIGMVTLIAIAVALSKHRKAINKRTVGVAFLIQFMIGAIVLYVPVGRDILNALSDGVSKVLSYGNQGVSFVFGGLVDAKMFELFGGNGFIFAFRVLPMIIFFSSLISVFYYLGIMGFVVKFLGGGLQKALGTSRTESLSAAANVFVGQTEAPLVVKPFIAKMTQSELFAIMTGGLASIAGSVLGGYAAMGVPLPYLIAASFMAAPGGLLFAKLMHPETETPELVTDDHLSFVAEGEAPPTNAIDAAAAGASTGLQIALNVGAMLIAFVAIIALLNGMVGGVGSMIGYPELSLQKILGWVFSPLALLIGAPWADAQAAGSFIGQKLVVNEFVAYSEFTNYIKDASLPALNEKTKAIISFALCGFANLSSIAILVGGLSIMAPNRRGDIAKLGIRALIAGTLSNLMSATIAGLFIGLTL
ncbi:NupC/NupG family nucleoside CNT transporter [Kingella negevensis]|uniref:Nucleoside permease n=1 Tax=Kingella negevensis TaxID=1522312 RepID=A0A238HFK6_9NEIS|nr:NupC/NupG family nucleoside CNT transporter [Kingella negevensis]MDK4681104.1 NupC/NupG family nucleoside CNT transporter [Kingella negevensis]MDK4683306.1 NupC/NupG family nucleoside CNT transporter [Kingella negevensis]MDK4684312.1 NupC/NupG family nucleoside CNT transporter [Kingella negevensis]MDK4688160.1 NupC/NupG family nucleoside CNT transporter [Kingella negevensis]MDK4691562.1 NupC/NupG family nucleoside CNT transporter [Kingella negevensis]